MFPYTCELISNADNPCLSCLMFIFYPLTALAGIGMSLCEFFPEAAGQLCE